MNQKQNTNVFLDSGHVAAPDNKWCDDKRDIAFRKMLFAYLSSNWPNDLDTAMEKLEEVFHRNPLTSLVSSNHGYWPTEWIGQNPFVCFDVLPGKYRAWQRIQERICTSVCNAITEHATLKVEERYELPRPKAPRVIWRFQSPIYENTWTLFTFEQEWKMAMAKLITAVTHELSQEVETI